MNLGQVLRRSEMEQLMAKQTETNLTEAEAIRQAKDGAAAAFEYLYKLHCRRVYGVCLRITKNPVEAEDLTQQAFLQLFRKIGTFRGESDFSTSLHRGMVDVVLMYLRRKRPTGIPAEDPVSDSSNGEGPREYSSSDTSMLGAIDRLNLMRAIRKLPFGYKQLFFLHDVFGYKHGEIAALVKRLRLLLLGETKQRRPVGPG